MLKARSTKVQKWQFESQHQPTSADVCAFKEVEDLIEYISDAVCTIGTFLCFAVEACPDIATECIGLQFHLQ